MTAAMNVTVDVICEHPSLNAPDSDSIASWCTAALTHQTANESLHEQQRSGQPCVISVRIVDRDEAAQLNHQYRLKDYATNILSFPADLPGIVAAQLDEYPLGDLVVCADIVIEEAQAQGKSTIDHWAHLIVHGVLHLCGMDHQNDEEAGLMEQLEIRILEGFNIANPYYDRSNIPA